jgi:hypothetical protein
VPPKLAASEGISPQSREEFRPPESFVGKVGS